MAQTHGAVDLSQFAANNSSKPAHSAPTTGEWFEDDNFDLDGLGEGPDIDDFEGESTFEQSQGGSN